MRGSTIAFRCDVGLQIVGHRPHLFSHSDDGQEPGELGDQVEVFRAEQKCFQPFSMFFHLARTPALQMKPTETSRRNGCPHLVTSRQLLVNARQRLAIRGRQAFGGSFPNINSPASIV